MYYRNVLDSKGWFSGGRTVGIVQLYWVVLRIVNQKFTGMCWKVKDGPVAVVALYNCG